MMHDDYRRRVRSRMLRERRRQEGDGLRHRFAVACCCAAAMLLMFAVMPSDGFGTAAANQSAGGTCRAALAWPVADPRTIGTFDAPAQPWLPGHRGVDLAAEPGTELLAPRDGTISYAGTVAGKSVVSIASRGMKLTFEPAETNLAVGAQVHVGTPFARVALGSDHCDGACVHWGVRRSSGEYLDPAAQTASRRIVLKPSS
ncbi:MULTISPECIES: M23 family metallopeptidase [Bifidobacterium]|uniref:M23 family metallopeptidase n=1 Tax=Bifidobacterium TaxID=1678 RepID=UPI001C57FD9B|nr:MULTISPECIES: peptidoglycan DD-metalloendopeptidase family protein [Bifidobacterium]MBW3077631.1 peptidoglycan DD-metalloendopeptidase family protein [Bifidobacterium simiiventris]